MADSLKPCPCCGSSAVFTPVQKDTPGTYDFERGRVECVKCDLRTGGTLAKAIAIANWNQRSCACAEATID